MEKIEQILKKIEEQVKNKKECAETFFNRAEKVKNENKMKYKKLGWEFIGKAEGLIEAYRIILKVVAGSK
jgi:hypothetical protein